MKINYQKKLDALLEQLDSQEGANSQDGTSGQVPRLFLHSCCAPCSSYVLEYLSNYFKITVFYYNPNIDPPEEYHKRVEEQQRFIQELPTRYPVEFLEGDFEPKCFYAAVKGLEKAPEGGARCRECFLLRLRKTAQEAKDRGMDYFTTTLSISPLKDAQLLNELGQSIGQEYGIAYLPSDFKKRQGYQRSVELSQEYGLYRQNYCGCVFSKRDQEN